MLYLAYITCKCLNTLQKNEDLQYYQSVGGNKLSLYRDPRTIPAQQNLPSEFETVVEIPTR